MNKDEVAAEGPPAARVPAKPKVRKGLQRPGIMALHDAPHPSVAPKVAIANSAAASIDAAAIQFAQQDLQEEWLYVSL
jgi:hypothetical protein